MVILILFALLSGIVTVLSPCVLPVLPIVLSSSASSGKRRPLGVITGLIISFSLFTLAISEIVKLLGLSASTLRIIAVAVIGILGLSMIIPKLNEFIEKALSFIPRMAGDSQKQGNGFGPGFITGLSLGLVWAPCAGPILASVTALAATQEITFASVIVVVAYAIGSGIPLLGIAYGGRSIIQKVPFLSKNLGKVQKGFGVIMILTAVLIALNVDVLVTTWLLRNFPSTLTSALSEFERSEAVSEQLDELSGSDMGTNYFVTEDFTEEDLQTGRMLPNLGPAPELVGINNWINSEPLTLEDLRGQVVLIDFWTYSCINCVRTLPYLTDWYDKYADDGFVIIGVHTPEFAFEEYPENVQDAVERFDIEYPVAQDNEYQTWRAYNNRYWPAKYFIDAEGNIRYTHFGEGDYDVSELVIRQLLADIGVDADEELSGPADVEFMSEQTPEIYIGYSRQELFASPEEVVRNEQSSYSIPDELPRDNFAVSGQWTFHNEYAQVAESGAQMKLHFFAQDVYMVLDLADQPGTVTVEVLSPDKENLSEDLNEQNEILVDEARLYHLVSFDEPVEGELILTFNQPGLQTFTFTFGS